MTTDPSPTNAFEDAEIAREEGSELDALRGKLVNVLSNAINYPSKVQPHILGQDMGPLISEVAEAILKAGYTRQSPASTTAADAPMQKPHSRACGFKKHDHGRDCSTNCPTCGGHPYRVAAPEGDGGNAKR